MDDGRIVKKLFESKPEERRKMGRLRWRWLKDVEKIPRGMKFKRRRRKPVDRTK
jgi:hypothetical protein